MATHSRWIVRALVRSHSFVFQSIIRTLGPFTDKAANRISQQKLVNQPLKINVLRQLYRSFVCPSVQSLVGLFVRWVRSPIQINQSNTQQPGSLGRSYRRTFCLNFQNFFSRNFLYFHIFQFFFHIGMRSVPNILPYVKFPKFGNVSCFSWKTKEEKLGKKLFDKNSP